MSVIYEEWSREYRETLKILPGKKVYVLYSGGKDSSLCLDMMLEASSEFGFSIEAHGGAFPLHRYLEDEKSRLAIYWKDRGVNVQWHDVDSMGSDLESAQNPCLVCQKLRKKLMHHLLMSWEHDWTRVVLVASYTLWDLVGYAVEHLLSNLFSSPKPLDEGQQRFIETGQRFYPLLYMKEGYMVFRPLLQYNTPEIVEYLQERSIPILSVPCKYKDFRPKRILENYYNKLGLMFEYNLVMDFARKSLGLPEPLRYTSADKDEYLKKLF